MGHTGVCILSDGPFSLLYLRELSFNIYELQPYAKEYFGFGRTSHRNENEIKAKLGIHVRSISSYFTSLRIILFHLFLNVSNSNLNKLLVCLLIYNIHLYFNTDNHHIFLYIWYIFHFLKKIKELPSYIYISHTQKEHIPILILCDVSIWKKNW